MDEIEKHALRDAFAEVLSAQGLVLAADERGLEHICMSIRGVQAHGARTTTSALLGTLRSDARTRQEFLDLVRS